MLDVAILDRSLFTLLEAAYDSALEMRHLRESLINFIETDQEHVKKYFETFPEYALSNLPEILTSLDNLYKECTGDDLKFIRLR